MALVSRLSRRVDSGRTHFLRAIVALLCLSIATFIQSVNATLLSTPNFQWAFALDGSDDNGFALGGRSLRQGNAVVPWRGGDKLFVTADDGSLHILDLTANGPTTSSVFVPTTVTRTFTECRSGVVVVGDDPDAEEPSSPYLIYAVIDTPIAATTIEFEGPDIVAGDDGDRITSRVMAVNMDGTLRWSVTVDGKISGTPVVGSNEALVYVSRTESSGKGFLSVILIDGSGLSAELTASLAPVDRDAPLGPPALQRSFDGENNNPSITGDLIVVAENWDNGYTEQGSIYLLSRSEEFEDAGGRGELSYQLQLISRSSWSISSVAAALFVGNSLYIGGTSATIAGWSANQDITSVIQGSAEDIDPRWLFQLDRNGLNASQPFLTSPEISSDGSLLYLAGASREFYCLQTSNGQETWTAEVESAILSPPVYYTSGNGQSVVYVVESMDGRVRQFDSDTGEENWQFNCQDATGISWCQNSVEADVSVSPSGNFLYYGDVYGRITAWEVGTFETDAPTAVPSAAPTAAPTAAPSNIRSPTVQPSALIVPSTDAPTETKIEVVAPDKDFFDDTDNALGASESNLVRGGGEKISMGVVIGAAAAGFLVVVAIACFVARSLRKSTNRTKKSTVETKISSDDAENDLESSGDDSDAASVAEVDDVTVTSESGCSVEVEIATGATTPKAKLGRRKSRKSKTRTPPTASTLASIEEIEDEEIHPCSDLKIDLHKKFSEVESVEEQDAGKVGSGIHSTQAGAKEQVASLTNLKSLADDVSVASEDSGSQTPSPPSSPPPPPKLSAEKRSPTAIEEEKKDGDSTCDKTPRTLSPQPSFGMASNAQEMDSSAHSASSRKSFFSAVAAALTRSPSSSSSGSRPVSPTLSAKSDLTPRTPRSPDFSVPMSPSVMSTDSSIYTNDNTAPMPAENLSPLSVGVFGETSDQASLPDDEAGALPSLQDSFHDRNDIVIRVPGAQYLSKHSTLRPKFKPSLAFAGPGIKSARTRRTLNGFSGSFLTSYDDSDGPDDEGRIISSAGLPIEAKKAPTFKRRSKKNEQTAAANKPIENTWSSFLQDLAAAEQQFFSPTHAQKSAVLRYNQDDSFDADSVDEDAETVRT